jgi:hypothetical protein
MSRILTVTIFALMLAGCASGPAGYDKSAVPNATAAMRQAMAICEKEQTASKITACDVAAQHDFAEAIHLTKMDAFDTYAAKMMALAAAWDAGRVSKNQLAHRAKSIRNDYWEACNCNPGGRGTSDWNAFVPSSDLSPPGVQLSSQP